LQKRTKLYRFAVDQPFLKVEYLNLVIAKKNEVVWINLF